MLLDLRLRIGKDRQFVLSEFFVNISAKVFEFVTFFKRKKASIKFLFPTSFKSVGTRELFF